MPVGDSRVTVGCLQDSTAGSSARCGPVIVSEVGGSLARMTTARRPRNAAWSLPALQNPSLSVLGRDNEAFLPLKREKPFTE